MLWLTMLKMYGIIRPEFVDFNTISVEGYRSFLKEDHLNSTSARPEETPSVECREDRVGHTLDTASRREHTVTSTWEMESSGN